MKALEQNYRKGTLRILEVSPPVASSGKIVVETVSSLVSTGTEKHMVDLARKSLLGKALSRPELVKRLAEKVRTEGVLETWRQTIGRLETPIPLGYSSSGVVVDVGPDVNDFSVGDRVACSGSGYASHAQFSSVPTNLCVKIPNGVEFESASFAAIGGTVLEAVRLARASLGETVAVIGLGLIGQITCQVLKSAGCHVIAMDIDNHKIQVARQNGTDDTVSSYNDLDMICRDRTAGHGVDAALIMAATDSNEPLEKAALICKERGRIVATGLVGLKVPRKAFYDKELELAVSHGWGAGMDDVNYVEKGLDYPFSHTRWTAKRNLAEFMRLLAVGSVQVDKLVTHQFPLEKAHEAYDLILGGTEPTVAVLLSYTKLREERLGQRIVRVKKPIPEATKGSSHESKDIRAGVIGAGQFAKGTMLPMLRKLDGLSLHGLATSTGLSARNTADRFDFEYCTTDYREIIGDPDIDLILILTRHGSHAQLATESIESQKHLFVEKPLALDTGQLQSVQDALTQSYSDNKLSPVFMVGFNRRFSPLAQWVKGRFAKIDAPLSVHCTVNAGQITPNSWIHDPEDGGGRIIGEVCHYIDLIQYFTGSSASSVHAESMNSGSYKPSDNIAVTIKMSNGGLGSIVYLSGGDKTYPRERIEVFGGSAVGIIDNFKSATFTHSGKTRRKRRFFSLDMGHHGEMENLVESIRSCSSSPVDFEEYVQTSLTTFAIEESLAKRRPVETRKTRITK